MNKKFHQCQLISSYMSSSSLGLVLRVCLINFMQQDVMEELF
jgi:hypothetical protein